MCWYQHSRSATDQVWLSESVSGGEKIRTSLVFAKEQLELATLTTAHNFMSPSEIIHSPRKMELANLNEMKLQMS